MNKTYTVQVMTIEDYNHYMLGSNNYSVKNVLIEAENAKLAVEIVKRLYDETYVVNPNCFEHIVKSDNDESEAEAERKEIEKKEAAKQRKIERDLAQGITPDMRRAMNNAKRYKNAIAKLEKELAELKAKEAYWEEKAKGD